MHTASDLIPRQTVTQICAQRDNALALYGRAFDALGIASDAFAAAAKAVTAASPANGNAYTYPSEEARKLFLAGIQLPDPDTFRDAARRLTDAAVWGRIMEMTDLERLMDKTAKDNFRRQLTTEPPEVTEGNVRATLEEMALNAGTIFRRGIATVFSNLDRRFRSHDGWRIGSRVILSNAFDDFGHWNHYRNHRDTLTDIERTFFVLDGRKQPESYAGVVATIDQDRRQHWRAHQSECETEFFTVRCFKNGNLHVWFKRGDLVSQVNRLIGEYYGAPIPEDRESEDDGDLFTPKTTPARNFGFFPTPDGAAERLFDRFPLRHAKDEPALTLLEPSAGTGNLARRAVAAGAVVDCIEIQGSLAQGLRGEGIYRNVVAADFLALKPNPAALYDRVAMNPPFDRERDIDHVMHALTFLKPGGILTAIMSAGTEFRETRKSKAFRALMAEMRAEWSDLPDGSFSSVGTNVNTIVLKVRKGAA
ncbi:Type I restriction-modification system methyltransferase subunit [uncultured Alphaproteobacteria bacterium]|uniref:Type I restriction-modification system methyltransferase subunit n=1 Tax=uncultured Alphaproteobacteria bacterium TaxID=91750 RepID=A0A212IVX9_9PROT|nr:Type I restriction-modification system methyltransferase subunit [uncultured Alphaproteobacteria bacterium]